MRDEIRYLLAGAIMALWFFVFMTLSWEKRRPAHVNIILGVLSYLIVGASYLLPFWMILK